jgi:hypothetical protein
MRSSELPPFYSEPYPVFYTFKGLFPEGKLWRADESSKRRGKPRETGKVTRNGESSKRDFFPAALKKGVF